MIEYLSMGAGPPSIALMILNAWGEIDLAPLVAQAAWRSLLSRSTSFSAG